MKRKMMVVALVMTPMDALAMPVIGDLVGTGADTVRAALDKAGCAGAEFEAEGGMVEAICIETANGKVWEVTIDPASGAVIAITAGED